MLSPDQFEGSYIEHDNPFVGKVRDLTSGRISRKSTAARDRLDVYRSARHAYDLEMENHALGYKTEEREYRQENPPPSWKGFLKEGFDSAQS